MRFGVIWLSALVVTTLTKNMPAQELSVAGEKTEKRARGLLPGKQGTGGVRQTLEAENVVIQQVKTDAELKPSVIEFTTDGSPVVVVYAGGCCKIDDLRRHRRGGYAILNAFELIQLSGADEQEN